MFYFEKQAGRTTYLTYILFFYLFKKQLQTNEREDFYLYLFITQVIFIIDGNKQQAKRAHYIILLYIKFK